MHVFPNLAFTCFLRKKITFFAIHCAFLDHFSYSFIGFDYVWVILVVFRRIGISRNPRWPMFLSLNESQWQSPVHLSSGHWMCNSHTLPCALLSGRKTHWAWCAPRVAVQRCFASQLPFPLARKLSQTSEGRLEAGQNDWAGRQTDYLCCYHSRYNEELFRWTEIQEPSHLLQ